MMSQISTYLVSSLPNLKFLSAAGLDLVLYFKSQTMEFILVT